MSFESLQVMIQVLSPALHDLFLGQTKMISYTGATSYLLRREFMDIILKALQTSVRHLEIIDEIFRSEEYPDKKLYIDFSDRIRALNDSQGFKKFTDELYVGGKKGEGEKAYGRQMILSDVFEYIINGRGYYYAQWNTKRKAVFIELVLNLLNQLILWDSLTVNHEIRSKVLKRLREQIGMEFFKEEEMEKRHSALQLYAGDIGFDTADKTLPREVTKVMGYEGNDAQETEKIRYRLDEYFDSILPKTAGGLWGELIVYLYLLRLNLGYVLPLLLNQRILAGGDSLPLKPPDFLVIREDGSLIGVEVGGGKEMHSGRFSSKVKCQMVTVENPRVPPRCPICGKKTLFCPKIIKDYADIENNPLLSVKHGILCAHECDLYKYEEVIEGKCPYTLYRGPVSQRVEAKQEIKYGTYYHYHYSCILSVNDKEALATVARRKKRFERKLGTSVEEKARINVLKINYPYVDGLETFDKNILKENIVCYGRFPNGKNCKFCNYTIQCEKLSRINELLKDIEGPRKEEAEKEIRNLLPQ